MHQAVIDTNVLVSSLIQRSYPYYIMHDLFARDLFRLCLSDALLQEYHDVLSRPKFSKFPDFLTHAERLLADISTKSRHVDPTIKLDLLSDKDDNKILELALACKADFIVTGNTNDFTFPVFGETNIVSPKALWELYAA